MKKLSNFIIILTLLINTVACTGYEPIFSSSNLKINIVDYSITGDKKLGNQIYLKLKNFSRTDIENPQAKDISILIDSSKETKATAKDATGKILSYKINLLTIIKIKDFNTDEIILNESFSYSSSYKVQDQYSETLNLENRIIGNLLDNTHRDLLIKLSKINL